MVVEVSEPAEVIGPGNDALRQFILKSPPPARLRLEHFRQYREPARRTAGRVHIHKVESSEPQINAEGE